MSVDNFNNRHMTDDDFNQLQDALNTAKQVAEKYLVNLSAEERQKYGRVNEQNKLLINKIYDYQKTQPELRAPEVDWAEFERDYTSRGRLESVITQLERLSIGLYNAKIMHDKDNYQAALTDYSYAGYKAGTQDPNFEKKVKDIKQFFTKGKTKGTANVMKE